MSTTETQLSIDHCLDSIRKYLEEADTYSVDFGFGIQEKPATSRWGEFERADGMTITIKINQPPEAR